METNPYAPPAASVEQPKAAPVLSGPAGEWSVLGVLRRSWWAYRRHWFVLGIPSLFGYVVSFASWRLFFRVGALHGSPPVNAIVIFLRIALCSVLEAGWVIQWLAAAKGERPTWRHLADGVRRSWALILVTFLQRLLIDGVSIYCSLFSIHQSASVTFVGQFFHSVSESWLGLARCAIVAEGATATSALQRAWHMSLGGRGRLFRLGLLNAVLGILGMLMLTLGSIPIDAILEGTTVVVYLALRQAESVAEAERATPSEPASAGGEVPTVASVAAMTAGQ